ncbi:MAG: redoxin domain-containing protein [Bacteroidota bacterium]|nr:redoxin domain-containing protein [Bacteroidota bacterium]
MKSQIISNVLDILTGVLTALITFAIMSYFSINWGFLLMTPFPIILGFLRGKNSKESLIIKVALMNILYFLLVFAIMNGVYHLLIIFAAAIFGTALGIYIRREHSISKFRALLSLVLYYIIVFFVFWGLPSYFDLTMWRKQSIVAPEYKLLSQEKDTLSSSDYTNKVVVMDFWGTWCRPCIEEFPEMEKAYKNYKGNKEVAFFIVNSNMNGDNFDKTMKFINRNSYDLPFVFDIERITADKFDVTSLPTVIIIDKKGIIRYKHYGYQESSNFNKKLCGYIDELLEEK